MQCTAVVGVLPNRQEDLPFGAKRYVEARQPLLEQHNTVKAGMGWAEKRGYANSGPFFNYIRR